MAILLYGATAAGVQGRIGFLTLTTGTEPSTTEVAAWLDEYAAEITGLLRAHGVDPAVVNAGATDEAVELKTVLRGKIETRIAAEVHAANQAGDTELAARYVAEWSSFVVTLRRNPDLILAGVGHIVTTRSHTTTGGETATAAKWSRGMDL